MALQDVPGGLIQGLAFIGLYNNIAEFAAKCSLEHVEAIGLLS